MKNEQAVAIIKDIANKHITPAEQRAIEKAIAALQYCGNLTYYTETKRFCDKPDMREKIKEDSNTEKLLEENNTEESIQNPSEDIKEDSKFYASSLAYVLHRTWKKKWKILIVFIVAFALSSIWILNVPR